MLDVGPEGCLPRPSWQGCSWTPVKERPAIYSSWSKHDDEWYSSYTLPRYMPILQFILRSRLTRKRRYGHSIAQWMSIIQIVHIDSSLPCYPVSLDSSTQLNQCSHFHDNPKRGINSSHRVVIYTTSW